MTRALCSAAVLAVALGLCACAASIAYRPEDVPDRPLTEAERVSGRVLVFTTQTDDDRRIATGATSVVGAGLKLSIPAGTMVREIALEVFSKAASGGADAGHELPRAGRYAVILRPQVENFEFGFPHREKLGVDVTPEVQVSLRLTLLDEGGRVRLEKDYDSGVVTGTRSLVSTRLVRKTELVAHEAIYALMRRAAADVHQFQQTEAAAAQRNSSP